MSDISTPASGSSGIFYRKVESPRPPTTCGCGACALLSSSRFSSPSGSIACTPRRKTPLPKRQHNSKSCSTTTSTRRCVEIRSRPPSAESRVQPPAAGLVARGARSEHARERGALERLKTLDAKALHGQDRMSTRCCSTRWKSRSRPSSFRMPRRSSSARWGTAELPPPRRTSDAVPRRRRLSRLHEANPRGSRLVNDTIEVEGRHGNGWMSTARARPRRGDRCPCRRAWRQSRCSRLSRASPMAFSTRSSRRSCGRARAIADEYQPALRRFKTFIGELSPEGAGHGGTRVVCQRRPLLRVPHSRADRARPLGAADTRAGHRRGRGCATRSARSPKRWDSRDRPMSSSSGCGPTRIFFDSSDAVLAAYRAMAGRVDPKLPKLFHTCRGCATPCEHDARRGGEQHRRELPGGLARARNERLLHDQCAGLRERGQVARGNAVPARSRARASHADRARRGDRGAPSVALAGELQHRLRRRLGPVCGMARLRPRVLQGSVAAIRQSAGSALPRGASRRRQRHTRFPVAARQGDRLHEKEGGVDRRSPSAKSTATSRIRRRRSVTSSAITRCASSRTGGNLARQPLRCEGLPRGGDRQRLDAARRARATGRRMDRARVAADRRSIDGCSGESRKK